MTKLLSRRHRPLDASARADDLREAVERTREELVGSLEGLTSRAGDVVERLARSAESRAQVAAETVADAALRGERRVRSLNKRTARKRKARRSRTGMAMLGASALLLIAGAVRLLTGQQHA